jgi:hypothetical protein
MADPKITVPAENAADRTGLVVMIDVALFHVLGPADGTSAALT